MAIPKVLTYQDVKNLLTGADYLDASDAGIIPSNFVTNNNSLIIQQDFDIYFWLRDTKKDLRFVNTITEKELEETNSNPPTENSTTQSPGTTVIPTECINTTHDKAYDYKKSIQEDGTVKYYFIGNFGKYKNRFPNWTEATNDGSYGTIRRDAIEKLVKFDCEAGQPISTPNPTPPSSSQTSNIIENSEDPNANNLYGTVIDEKTNDPIKGANLTYGTLSAITNEKGEFLIKLPTQDTSSISISSSIDTPPTPSQIPINPTSQLRTITGEIQVSDTDPGATNYNGLVRLVKNELGDITDPPYQTRTNTEGKFELFVPIDSKFIQARKPNSTQTIILPLTQETNYIFDFSSQVNSGVVQEQVETTVTASRIDLEASAVDYETKTVPVIKGDGTLKNDLGFIPLKTTKADLDKEIIDSVTPTEEEVEDLTKDKKDFRWRLNQKLIDLLNKLKNILLPIILTMIARFGVTKVQELIKEGKNKAEDIQNKTCPSQEELDRIIKRKNKFVKQINNSLKVIDTTLKVLGISRSFIDIALAAAAGIDIAQLFLPTATPGLTAGAINKADDIKKDFQDKAKITKQSIDGTILVLNFLRITLTQIVTYLNLLDSLVQDCYPEAEQEKLSAELIALTQEQAEQESPVVTIVNGFTMGVETENTTNSLKRRRATATNAGGVVMLRGEWSFSSIDQILIDELVFYIQVNDLKAD